MWCVCGEREREREGLRGCDLFWSTLLSCLPHGSLTLPSLTHVPLWSTVNAYHTILSSTLTHPSTLPPSSSTPHPTPPSFLGSSLRLSLLQKCLYDGNTHSLALPSLLPTLLHSTLLHSTLLHSPPIPTFSPSSFNSSSLSMPTPTHPSSSSLSSQLDDKATYPGTLRLPLPVHHPSPRPLTRCCYYTTAQKNTGLHVCTKLDRETVHIMYVCTSLPCTGFTYSAHHTTHPSSHLPPPTSHPRPQQLPLPRPSAHPSRQGRDQIRWDGKEMRGCGWGGHDTTGLKHTVG